MPRIIQRFVDHLLGDDGATRFTGTVVVDAISKVDPASMSEGYIGRVFINQAVVVVVNLIASDFGTERTCSTEHRCRHLWPGEGVSTVAIVIDSIFGVPRRLKV